MARSALLNVMVAAASKAGRSLTRDFGEIENLQISLKGPGDFVSQADLKAEKTLRDALNKDRPGYSFLMEEGGVIDTGSDHRWIIDPLDGTTNYLHGHPFFAVSLALESNGQLVAGVIYNPITEELFTAERGRGAFVNDRRMRVANRHAMDECLIATGVPALNKKGHGGRDVRTAQRDEPDCRCQSDRLSSSEPGLCRSRTVRRLLGVRPFAVGCCSGHVDGSGSGWFCD